MTDEDYFKSVKEIVTPESMLKELVKKIEDGTFGHDPYYAKIKEVMLEQAKEVIKNPQHDNHDGNHEIQRDLVVSSRHITLNDKEILEGESNSSGHYVVYEYEYGFYVWVEPEKQWVDYFHFSPDFQHLIYIAKKLNCQYLKIDSDGNEYPDLPLHDW